MGAADDDGELLPSLITHYSGIRNWLVMKIINQKSLINNTSSSTCILRLG